MKDYKDKLEKADELFESKPAKKRIKFNLSEIEEIAGPKIEEPTSSIYALEAKFSEPEPEIEEPAPSVVKVEPIKDEPVQKEKNKPKKEPVQTGNQQICIIDETSTSVVIEQGPDISVNEIVSSGKSAKTKKPKEPLKLKPVQIVIMAVAVLIALWFVMFTVDHTLAANGVSPVFCRETETFMDGSASYKGLGYKVQFKFDSNGNLTQKVCPAWQEGPNDIIELPAQ